MSEIRDRIEYRVFRHLYVLHGGCCNGSEEQCNETMKTILAIPELSFEKGRLEGIKEVVEWLERTRKQKVPQYQLKEWGLE